MSLFVVSFADLGIGVYFTGGSLNPARSFGPDVIAAQFNGYHWIYWVGPGLGSLVAVGFYKLVKGLEYETVNPGQDAARETEKEEQQEEAEIEEGEIRSNSDRSGDGYHRDQHPAHANYNPPANYHPSSGPAGSQYQQQVKGTSNQRADDRV